MYERALISMMVAVVVSLAVFVQATAAKPVSSQAMQQHPIVSEKLAGLGTDTQQAPPIVSEKLAGLDLQAPSTTVVASGGDKFEWDDAGIGAGVVLGTMLLGTGLVLTVRRREFPFAQ